MYNVSSAEAGKLNDTKGGGAGVRTTHLLEVKASELTPFLRVLLQTQGNHLPEGFAVFLNNLLVRDAGLQARGVILQRQHQDLKKTKTQFGQRSPEHRRSAPRQRISRTDFAFVPCH